MEFPLRIFSAFQGSCSLLQLLNFVPLQKDSMHRVCGDKYQKLTPVYSICTKLGSSWLWPIGKFVDSYSMHRFEDHAGQVTFMNCLLGSFSLSSSFCLADLQECFIQSQLQCQPFVLYWNHFQLFICLLTILMFFSISKYFV